MPEVRERLLFLFELFAPFLDKRCDTVLNLQDKNTFRNVLTINSSFLTYLSVHFRVVEHSDELLHEVLIADLFVERGIASVHKDIKGAKSEENDLGVGHLKTLQQLI